LRLKPWERKVIFSDKPTQVRVRAPSFVNFEGNMLNEKELQVMPDSAEKSFNSALAQNSFPSIDDLIFPYPNSFKAGQIHTRVAQWKKIIANTSQTEEILD